MSNGAVVLAVGAAAAVSISCGLGILLLTSQNNPKSRAKINIGKDVSTETSSTVTAPLETRVAEMIDANIRGFPQGQLVTKNMTGSDKRIYLVVPNGTEAQQLKGLEELQALIRKVYASAAKRHGKDDVYVSRLSTLIEDPVVSYINSQDVSQGYNAFTSLYPAGKPAAKGIPPHPYICMIPWWQAIMRTPALTPKDEAAYKAKVWPYWIHLFLHEVGHAISGLFGHQEQWQKAWHWVMQEAEAAGVWKHASLVAMPDTIMSKDAFKFDPKRFYSWDPYSDADLKRNVAAAKALFPPGSGDRGQVINLWKNPKYKPGNGCPGLMPDGLKEYPCT